MTASVDAGSPAVDRSLAGPAAMTPGFRRLAVLTSAWVWLLIVIGGVVRVTGSGLGCPDWPLCYGQALPPPETTARIEFSHRLVAGVGGLLILGMAIVAWRRYRDRRWIAWPAALMVVMLGLQFLLGAAVVLTELEPLSVAVHLGAALIIFACSLVVALVANRPAALDREVYPARYEALVLAAVVALFLLLTTGAVVVGEGASYACPDWPLCQGRIGPAADAATPALLHLGHRYAAAAVGVLLLVVVGITLRDRAARPLASRWAILLGALFLVQVGVGALQIWSHLATVWRVVHLGAAAGVWAALVILAALICFPGKARAGAGDS